MRNAAVVGLGTMGRSIARMLGSNDVNVAVFDTRAAGLESARSTGLTVSRIAPTIASCVDDADIVFEATTEDLGIKHAVLREISEASQALIASNTSTFVPSSLAQAVRNPERFLVAHFFNPADLIPLVEIVPGPATAAAAVDAVVETLRAWGKHPVRLAHEPAGFVANRLQAAMLRESFSLIADGIVTAHQIDEVVTASVGPRWAALGPIQVADLGGLDVFAAVCTQIFPTLNNAPAPNRVLLDRTVAGQLGEKTGAGFYPTRGKLPRRRWQRLPASSHHGALPLKPRTRPRLPKRQGNGWPLVTQKIGNRTPGHRPYR